MAIYEELFDELQSYHPQTRLIIVNEKQEQLEQLSSYELDRIALMLLAASSSNMKDEYPVEGESRVTRSKPINLGAFT